MNQQLIRGVWDIESRSQMFEYLRDYQRRIWEPYSLCACRKITEFLNQMEDGIQSCCDYGRIWSIEEFILIIYLDNSLQI